MPAPRNYLDNRECIETLLARWPEDRRFYVVDLISSDKNATDSLVKFEDGQSYPIPNKDLHIQLNLDKINDEAILCCLCEHDNSESPNLIILCDLCQLGYHVGCHQPPIEAAFLEDSEMEWYCETCLEISQPDRRRKKIKGGEAREPTPKRPTPKKILKRTPKKKSQNEDKLASKDRAVKETKLIVKLAKKVQFEEATEKVQPEVTIDDMQVEKIVEKETAEPLANHCLEVALVSNGTVDKPQDLRIGEGDKKERLANGSTLEHMDPIVIETAKTLSEAASTGDFISEITPVRLVENPNKAKTSIKGKFKSSRKKEPTKPEPA